MNLKAISNFAKPLKAAFKLSNFFGLIEVHQSQRTHVEATVLLSLAESVDQGVNHHILLVIN